MLTIRSLVPLSFPEPAWTSGSSRFTYCWSLAWRILSISLLYHVKWEQLCGSLSILWHCLSLDLEWKLTFSSPGATAEISKFAGILRAALSQHHAISGGNDFARSFSLMAFGKKILEHGMLKADLTQTCCGSQDVKPFGNARHSRQPHMIKNGTSIN